MRGSHHRLVAAAAWPAATAVVGLPHWQGILGIPVAVAFSHGVTSCDIDNTRWWKKLDRWIPDEMLGDGGPLAHRELMHWWGLPAFAGWLVWALPLGPLAFLAWAAITGWSSHIAADAAFGRGGMSIRAGVPVLPWGRTRVTLGFKSDGLASGILVWPICGSLWWVALGHPGTHQAVAWAASR